MASRNPYHGKTHISPRYVGRLDARTLGGDVQVQESNVLDAMAHNRNLAVAFGALANVARTARSLLDRAERERRVEPARKIALSVRYAGRFDARTNGGKPEDQECPVLDPVMHDGNAVTSETFEYFGGQVRTPWVGLDGSRNGRPRPARQCVGHRGGWGW
jgi:hypothetical protein